MPVVTPPSRPRPAARETSLWRSHTRRDQLFACVLGAAFLVGAAFTQSILSSRRQQWNLVRETPESEKTLRSLAVTFPRLTLGGLRGIVSTVLWEQAEEDKTDRKWLDLETKYDMIGALQPYFVSVYIFHSWNQAYNLSAQWQERDSKYKWVLDGLAYLYKGEEYNPGVAELYMEEGHLYFLKLGSAYERIFYRQHWREDIARLYQLNDKREAQDDKSVALRHVREIVDRPYFNATELPDPSQRTNGRGWGIQIVDSFLFSGRADGKRAGEPMDFRYGLSPFYFAYVEYKRCADIATVGSLTIDTRPAMSLRLWCRDDIYYIGQTLNDLFGTTPNDELLKDGNKFAAKTAEMHDCYRNVQMIGPRAIELFELHLGRVKVDETVHRKHILETQAFMTISKAEIKLFDTLTQWHLNGRKLTPQIIRDLQEADNLYQDSYKLAVKWVDTVYPIVEGEPANPDRADFERYAIALQGRSKGIETMLTLPADQKPDMSFLEDDVVER